MDVLFWQWHTDIVIFIWMKESCSDLQALLSMGWYSLGQGCWHIPNADSNTLSLDAFGNKKAYRSRRWNEVANSSDDLIQCRKVYAWWWRRVCSQKEMDMLTTSLKWSQVLLVCVNQLVTLPAETGAQSHLRRGVMGNFRYRSWRQLRPVTTLITVAEHEYVWTEWYVRSVLPLCRCNVTLSQSVDNSLWWESKWSTRLRQGLAKSVGHLIFGNRALQFWFIEAVEKKLSKCFDFKKLSKYSPEYLERVQIWTRVQILAECKFGIWKAKDTVESSWKFGDNESNDWINL